MTHEDIERGLKDAIAKLKMAIADANKNAYRVSIETDHQIDHDYEPYDHLVVKLTKQVY